MFSSVLRRKSGKSSSNRGLFSSSVTRKFSRAAARRALHEEQDHDAAEYRSVEEGDEPTEDEEEEGDGEEDKSRDDEDGEGENDDGLTPLLPIFEAAHLDALPVYNLTHTIRLLIIPRCETTLSWDQLRSPQVSQFLVRPIQQDVKNSHFSRATLYALMANCLQFGKEAQSNPGNTGTSKTRALVCELLAIKLLKEYSTRELIDALSYDFYPLQGLLSSDNSTVPTPKWDLSHRAKPQARVARVSALEIAIRAQSKRFLAHPLVVQQLEAIWAGTIVFHSAADNLHRSPAKLLPSHGRGYGAIGNPTHLTLASSTIAQVSSQRDHLSSVSLAARRSVTLYDPREASVFKLSRLRVPRYRQFLSTCSFAVLLFLFIEVLIQRSLHITALEVVFWLWSAGFMLDEIVGFNEQGFSLYIMSFWNTFDLGILMLLFFYYCLRLYGILMPDLRKHSVAGAAYDILAANAVLLFPRLFSVLDHSRYFSQLLIAFRMMAVDLAAVFVLIIISCSGFFVAFTLAFGREDRNGGDVAYALFQMLMGFTPAAWDQWDGYNILGKGILTLFLFICHFLIVTILITVLTNSFMAIVQNANDEHQFVFAVNTISLVKSDALFSYVAPTNILAWLLTPLRFLMPFRQFVHLNRLVIKITHFPVLLIIYAYERTILPRSALYPTELVEQRGRDSMNMKKPFENAGGALGLFSPTRPRLREPSVATFHKDKALAEVFRRPFRGNSNRLTQRSRDRQTKSTVVDNWMQNMGSDGRASPPQEQDHSIVDRLESRRSFNRRSYRRHRGPSRNFSATTRSVASDPEEFIGSHTIPRPQSYRKTINLPRMNSEELPQPTEDDGDDELVTNEDTTADPPTFDPAGDESDYFNLAATSKLQPPAHKSVSAFVDSSNSQGAIQVGPSRPVRKTHMRNISTNTILYNPHIPAERTSTSPSHGGTTINKDGAAQSPPASGTATATASAGRRTPKRQPMGLIRSQAMMPPRSAFQSTPNLSEMLMLDERVTAQLGSPIAFDIVSDLGDNKAVGGGFIGAVPASLASRMAYASGAMKAGKATTDDGDDQRRMSKLMLARMNALEEGFRDVLNEVKEWRREETRSTGDERYKGPRRVRKSKKEGKEMGKGEDEEGWMDDAEAMAEERGSSV